MSSQENSPTSPTKSDDSPQNTIRVIKTNEKDNTVVEVKVAGEDGAKVTVFGGEAPKINGFTNKMEDKPEDDSKKSDKKDENLTVNDKEATDDNDDNSDIQPLTKEEIDVIVSKFEKKFNKRELDAFLEFFWSVDKFGFGFFTFPQLVYRMRMMRVFKTQRELAMLFADLDHNMDKVVSLEEFLDEMSRPKPKPRTTMSGKILKVWSLDRKTRKGVVTESFEDLRVQCCQKFNLDSECQIRFVLNDDGTEVDEVFYSILMPGTVLMVLLDDEEWQDINNNPGTSTATIHGTESHEIAKLVENIRKKSSSVKKKPEHSSIRIIIGWLNYSYKDGKYKQIRSSKGEKSLTDNVVLRADATYDEILQRATNIFFPKGKSKKGRIEMMELLLGTAKGEVINKEGFSLGRYVSKLQTQHKRIYLLSKAKYTLNNISTEEDSDFELPEINVNKRPRLSTEVSDQLQAFNFNELTVPSDKELSPTGIDLQDATPTQQAPLVQQHVDPFFPATPTQPVVPIQQIPELSHQATPSQPQAISMHINAGTPTVSFNVPTCCVCYDRDRNTALIPCGHMFCCVCATAQFHASNRKCPLCRKHITDLLEIIN